MARHPSPFNRKAAFARGATKRRHGLRDALWPDADGIIFPTVAGGWCQMPRTIPIVASLIDTLGGKEHAGRLYLTLWTYEFGDGFVEVQDPALIALEAGYTSSRAERTFEERISVLAKLGFIRTAPLGMREFGYVLLLDPHSVVSELKLRSPELISSSWWSAFSARCSASGITLTPRESSPESSP